ncbi:MAG: GNAT family N-acetyltransferase, partial [Chloroflexota bacterium]
MQRTYPLPRVKASRGLDLLFLALGLAGAIFFALNYERALPSASVNLAVSRADAERKVEGLLREFGYSPDGYKFTLSFSEDEMASFYLQRALGVEETNRKLLAEKLPIHAWDGRWFIPLQKEEFYVSVSPEGDFRGFSHLIPEDAPGADLPEAEAQTIAEGFLAKYADWNPADWERIEASSEARPGGRVDHTFVWKSRRYEGGGSELRITVVVLGDQVGEAAMWIKVPESFERDFASERGRAGFIDNLSTILGYLVFIVVAAVAFALGKPDIRRASRPAALVMLVALALYLNFIPLADGMYSTTEDYALFWTTLIVGAFFLILFEGAQVFMAWGGGQAFSKFVWSRQDRILARVPDRLAAFTQSAVRGVALGGFHLGYVVLFYLIATRFFGWWTPVTSEYSNLQATPFPFLISYYVGLSAALNEELLFRLIGIAFLLWLFPRQRWLAVLVPGLLWAFAHASYVASPIYARGIELTFIAVIDGLIFLRFGLLTTIVGHFSYNMIVSAMPLLRSSDPYFQLSGWIVLATVAAPLLPGAVASLRKRLLRLPSGPDALTLAPADSANLPALSALPVKADWPSLLADARRTILCLWNGEELVGFATGFTGEKNRAHVDGIYVVPRWRRQYWGATLLDAL